MPPQAGLTRGRTRSHRHPSRQRRKILCHFLCIHTTEKTWKNYSPFLLEAAVTVWGMDSFNKYLKDKQFILYTDHKLLKLLGHLHNKTLHRLQMALLEHKFIIQYRKGSNMPAEYWYRFLVVEDTSAIIAAFDPFQPGLQDLQLENENLKQIQTFVNTGWWPKHPTRKQINLNLGLQQ